MERQDLRGQALYELLALRNAIDEEISDRGYSRTSSSLAGELMERAVADAYGGSLVQVGRRSVDVIASDGRRVQVKTRSLPAGDMRHWAFGDFDFDLAIVISVDRRTMRVDWARELSSREARVLARPHSSDGWRIRMEPAKAAGIDVTAKVNHALDELK